MIIVRKALLTNSIHVRAPKYTMFHIHSIYFVVTSALSGSVYVLDREYVRTDGNEASIANADDIGLSDLASFRMTNAGSHSHITGIDHKCKNITIAKDNNAASNVKVYIYGDIIPASKRELIIEWFLKRSRR